MRDLHVVAVSEDGRHVVLATRRNARTGQFRVAVDERLIGALRGEAPLPDVTAPTSLSPREIQRRLRAGESVEQIARSAGVPLERVERYAGPVLAERDRVVDGGRISFVHRPRLGPSGLPLAEAVERNLAENPAYQPESARWSARREESGGWVVELSWSARGRRRTSGWRYDLRTRELSPVDASSAALGHVDAGAAGAAGASSAQRRSEPAPRRSPAAARAAQVPAEPAPSRPAAAARTPAARTPAARTPAPAAVPPAPRRSPAAKATGAAAAAETRAATGDGRTSVNRKSRGPTPEPPAQPAMAEGRPATGRPAASSGRAGTTRAARAPGRAPVAPAAASDGARRLGREAPAAPAAAPPAASRRRPAAGRATARAAATGGGPPVGEMPSGPPTLRVVPPAPDVDHEATTRHTPAPAGAPVRRAVGERAGPDWADVLFGAAPPATPQGDRASE